MKINIFLFVITSCFFTNLVFAQAPRINIQKDLLLVQYDCKTDVDDLHSVAAFSTIIAAQKYSKLNYHAVAGTYGVQEGLYVPPNDLFELAFGDQWSDAHKDFEKALNEVAGKVEATLKKDGNIWIAEAGQSDFTAAVVKAVKALMPDVNTTKRIHVVQHSNWNEEVTTPEKLAFVKKETSYHKISDGNAVGNGTPGFRTAKKVDWQKQIIDPKLVKIWETALKRSNRYNGKEGRYNNEAIAAGGLDFSDTAEVCWMLGLENIHDAEAFFRYFAK